MPLVSISLTWVAFSLMPSMPPCIFGCRVLSLPSSISGKPVYEDIGMTFTPAFFMRSAVPPVEIISTPAAESSLANSAMPVLSVTLIMALLILLIRNLSSLRLWPLKKSHLELFEQPENSDFQ
jgi:hypothetical protein